jgi:hypothetical protein
MTAFQARLFTLIAAAILTPAASDRALSQDDCARPPVRIGRLENVAELLVIRTGQADFAVTANCHTVRRSTFGTTLNFAILNRFPEGSAVTDAYVYVKSYRILTTAPPIKFSLSRGDGWFLQEADGTAATAAPRMAFEPFAGGIEKWNPGHATAGTPFELGTRLGARWHAFTAASGGSSSTVPIEFWTVPDSFDRIHGVQTNYLIRFTVNTSDSLSTIPFQVFIQSAVTQVELTLLSNIDALSGTYKFIVR